MQRKLLPLTLIALLVSVSGCDKQPGTASTPSVTASVNSTASSAEVDLSAFKPVATLQEIMLSVIDPNIDPIWNSISTESSAEGIIEKRPESDEDWAVLRNHAITLREVSNLLVIPGRDVAHPKASTSIHHSELQSDAIETLIAAQWPEFILRAQALQDAANLAVLAIEAKDVDRLEEVGGIIEHACEGCHSQFWYPGDKRPTN